MQTVVIGSKNLDKLPETTNYSSLLLYIYVAGLLISGFLFLLKLLKLWRLIQQNPIKNFNGNKLVLIKNQANAFSVFNYIFIDAQFYRSGYLHILKHEQVHVKQKHWLDLWFVEMLKIIFWFNPMLYLYQVKLKELHEYIADAEVLRNIDKATYFNQLLQNVFQTTHLSFVNQFYKPSLIKKRIKMQKKQRSGIWAKLKYAVAVVSLLGIVVLVDACKDNNVTSKNKEVIQTSAENIEESYDFQNVAISPVYPGCENLDSAEAKKCFSKNISQFISDNFNRKVHKVPDSIKTVKIFSVFNVDKNGKVVEIKVKSKIKEFGDEAKRVLSLLPQMTPGKANGHVVKVRYTLPIVFRVEK